MIETRRSSCSIKRK